MSHGHCSCPDCGTILRIRDRSFVGRQIHCPECKIPLVIKLNDDREYLAERPKAESKPEAATVATAPSPGTRSGPWRQIGNLAHSPLVMAWALAIGVTAFAAIVMLRPSVRFRNAEDPRPQVAASSNPQLPVEADTHKESGATGAADENPIATMDAADAANPETISLPPETPTKAPLPEPIIVKQPVTTPNEPGAANAAPPVVPPVAVAPQKIDVEQLLQQRISKFSTRVPLSRVELIETVEEMLGAKIRYNRDELGEKNLERKVEISLEGTTVGGILKALVDSAGWEFLIEDTGLRLKPRQVAGPMPS